MKKLMAPVLMLTAVFSGVSARAQQIAPLPDAPVPQASDSGKPAIINLQLPDLSSPRHPYRIDLYGNDPQPKKYDFSLPQDAAVKDEPSPMLPGKVGRVAVFANQHMINGEQGYDLAAEVRVKDRFTIVAGTPDTRYNIPDNRWQTGGLNLKPEITIPGAWNTDTSHVSLRPKGRGVMIGLKVKFH